MDPTKMKPRPCGCKGCRTCKVCETQYGANEFKLELRLDRNKSFVYCPYCNAAWSGWDMDASNQHPEHKGEKMLLPGVYIQLNYITNEEENDLVNKLDEMPWDTSQSGRRKQNFGPKTNFKKRKISVGKFDGFPQFSKYLQDKFHSIDLLNGYEVIEQCSLEYDPTKGASIDPHIDDCWIWGERIITINCLSDSVLTMMPYKDKNNLQKYNLECAKTYGLVISYDKKINTLLPNNAFEASKPLVDYQSDIVIRIPMPRRSLLVLYGEARYHWEHCVLREDITSRRVCLAYREFTPPYFCDGKEHVIGNEIRQKANQFWDHKEKYGLS